MDSKTKDIIVKFVELLDKKNLDLKTSKEIIENKENLDENSK